MRVRATIVLALSAAAAGLGLLFYNRGTPPTEPPPTAPPGQGAVTPASLSPGYFEDVTAGWGRLALFHNEPVDPRDPTKGRKFVDVSARAGLDRGVTWATSAAFGDLDGDGFPDLYVCQYVNWSWANNPRCKDLRDQTHYD